MTRRHRLELSICVHVLLGLNITCIKLVLLRLESLESIVWSRMDPRYDWFSEGATPLRLRRNVVIICVCLYKLYMVVSNVHELVVIVAPRPRHVVVPAFSLALLRW